jgi:hypothetical protein
MKTARFVLVLLLALSISTVAMAQDAVENDEFGVTVVAPDAWETTTDDDKAVANFKHGDSQSQIQVIGTRLMTAEVADTFFNTFHKTLTESNFEKVGEESATIGDYEGKKIDYAFTHSGVTMEVVVFEFMRDQTAWLVIGYMQDEERANHEDAYLSVIENLRFSEGG